MAPRRTTRRSAGAAADTATPPATTTKPKTTTPATTTTTTTTKYESKAVPKQVTFPARRKIVKTYGHHKTRRSLPARLELEGEEGGEQRGTPGSEGNKRRSLRQQTLTQIDYVRSSSSSGAGGGEGLLRVEDGDQSELDEKDQERIGARKGTRGRKQARIGQVEVVGEEEEMKIEGTDLVDKRRTAQRKSKRRKTAGDVPIPGLERKGSSFHTQTLTQFVGKSGLRLGETGDDDELRVDDEGDEVKDLPLSVSNTPVKRTATRKGKGKMAAPDPHTPSNKRIKVKLEEVPSSQTTPFTPLLGHSPLKLERSPLTQKSTNLDAALPTMETVSKIPRTLVIQDSYSVGSNSSVGFPSSSAGEIQNTPKKEEKWTPTTQDRAPLAEIPIGSIELGVESTPAGEMPTARKKRMFVEIPDSEDELESVGSMATPFKTRSTQQTPRSKRQAVEADNEDGDFKIAADPRSTPRVRGAVASETPVSTGRSDKENETPVVPVLEDEDDEHADEMGEREGTPTPTQGRKSQAASRGSQVTPRTASQFWTTSASAGDVGGFGATTGSSGREALSELAVAVVEEPASSRDKRGGTPTVGSQFHGSIGESEGRARRATPEIEDTDETASEAEEEVLDGPGPVPVSGSGLGVPQDMDETASEASEDEQRPPSILRKSGSQRTPRNTSAKKTRSSPNIGMHQSLETGNGPTASSPAVKKVQIAVPDSSAEEVYKETPRKPKSHKSSPIYQRHTQTRHTQARSQYYSQGLESQRVPMDIIRALGPQTDRSDIIISIHPKIVDNIINGAQDHEFRNYKFPVQVLRCWIYTDLPVGEVKYMATLGPAQEPGQLDRHTGFGNVEFNEGTSGYRYAHKLRQVYRLNNPVPLADMAEHGMGDGAPQRYRYLPLAVVGQLLANLRCPLFAEEEGENWMEDDVEDEGGDAGGNEGGMTISQELEDQLRTDILHSTQKLQRHRPVGETQDEREEHEEEEEMIPASQSPIKKHSTRNTSHTTTTRYYQPPRTTGRDQTSRSQIRPSQATTASEASQPSGPTAVPSRDPPSPIRILTSSSSAVSVVGSDPASVPRPPLPDEESSGLSSVPLPRLGYGYNYGSTGTGRNANSSGNGNANGGEGGEGEGSGEGRNGSSNEESSEPPMSLGRARMLLSSSQVGVLPPDSLLVEDVRMAPPPVEVWDSDEDV